MRIGRAAYHEHAFFPIRMDESGAGSISIAVDAFRGEGLEPFLPEEIAQLDEQLFDVTTGHSDIQPEIVSVAHDAGMIVTCTNIDVIEVLLEVQNKSVMKAFGLIARDVEHDG